MEAQVTIALVIGTIVVLFVPGLVWVTVTAGMGEVFQWAGGFLRVLMAVIIMLTPGIVFWLVVIGVIVILRRWSRTDLYQIIQGSIRESLKAVTERATATTKLTG